MKCYCGNEIPSHQEGLFESDCESCFSMRRPYDSVRAALNRWEAATLNAHFVLTNGLTEVIGEIDNIIGENHGHAGTNY